MSSWKALLAAGCMVLASSAASAAVLYRGLSHTASGAATITSTPDGRLVVSNIGSSGQDGVSVSCPDLDGMRVRSSGALYVTDSGASLSLTYRYLRAAGSPEVRSMSLTCAVDASSVAVSADHSSGLPTGRRIRCSSGGVLVLDSGAPVASSVSVEIPQGGSCPVPELSCARDRSSGELRWTVEFSSPQSVTVGGSVVVCDAVMFSVDDDDDDAVGDACDLRVTSPPGSSLSTLSCDRVDFVSHGQFMSGEGQVDVLASSSSSQRRLEVRNLGSSGQDGVSLHRAPGSGGGGGGAACSPATCGLAGACRLHFALPSLSFDPRVDEGAGCVTRVRGSSSSVSSGVLGSMVLTISGSSFRVLSSFTGMGADAESCVVFDRGVEVYRGALASGTPVVVEPPPGGPLGMAINEKGLPGEKGTKVKKKTTAPQPGPGGPARPASATDVTDVELLPLSVGFVDSRVFVFGGQRVTGDQLVCWGEKSSSAGTGSSLHVTSQEFMVRCPSSGSSMDVTLLDVTSSSSDRVSAVAPPSSHLSSSSTCVAVPVVIDRADATPARAYTVTLHLSPELAQCVTGVVEGDYLSRAGQTQMFVVDNGGGSYTVDCGVLGPACGSTGDGTLFTLHLSASAAAPSSGAYGSVFIDAVSVRDCSNGDVPGAPGSSAHLPIDFSPPSPLSSFTAAQVTSGNDADGTTATQFSWSPVSPDEGVAVYRRSYGGYPEYDDAPGTGVPTPPASPQDALAQGWAIGDLDADGREDLVASKRGYDYYVAFVRDRFGNASSASSMTAGTLNYHLGDVSDGLAACSGNNAVGPEDISLLGAHYGSSLSFGSSVACLDVGPTTDRSVRGRPMTDNRIGFEDFMMFAMNYSSVSAPRLAAAPAAAAANVVRLEAPPLPAVGATFDAVLRAEGAGDVQALSLRLGFDPAVLEQVAVAAGDLLLAQGRESMVLSPGAGQVDAALLGAGPGLSGAGELARVTFRVRSQGEAGLVLAGVDARDGENRAVPTAGVTGTGGDGARTGLSAAYPNPFEAATEVRFGLARGGHVSLGVFDVAGRRVRTLLKGVQPAGERSVSWDGRDDAGVRLAPGAYVVRFESGERRESRVVKLVR